LSKHRKAQGHRPPGDKKPKANGKKVMKEKMIAAELGEAVMREPPPAPEPVPVPVAAVEPPAPVKPVVKAKTPEPQAPAAKKKAPEPPPAPAEQKAPAPQPAAMDHAPEPPLRLLENAVDTFERSFKAAGQGTMEVNRKLIDFTRANVSSGFDFAMSLASAASPVQIVQLQMSYWDERLKVLASQAEELRALSAALVAKANEPIREQMRRARRP
jgi:outer membrane biosynthesis protein TonB